LTENAGIEPILKSSIHTKGLQVTSITLECMKFQLETEELLLKSEVETVKMDMLKTILTEVVVSHSEVDKIGLLFSGGLDSSVLAKILLDHVDKRKLNFTSVGKDKSPDLMNANEGASLLGVNLHLVLLTMENFRNSLKELKKIKTIKNPGDLTVAIPLYLGMSQLALVNHVKTIFLGQGADEIFGGYFKYKLLVEQGRKKEVIKEMEEDLKHLIEHQLLMEKEIANKFGVRLVYPYLESKVLNLAKSLPFDLYFRKEADNSVIRKVFLRNFAQYINLPDHFVQKEKKAMQYGSGSVKMLRSYVGTRGFKNIRTWFNSDFMTESY